jgi:hypothetical protein
MRVTIENLKSLRTTDPTLYAYVVPACRGVGDAIEIDLSQIKGEAHRKLLEAWARENEIEEPLSSSHGQFCGCDPCFRKRTQEEMAKAAEKQLQAGVDRLNEYFAAGLENTEANRELFMKTWKEHPKLSQIKQSSPQVVDAVIALVRDKFAWRKAEPTPMSVAPPQPVVTLSDGSQQKSLEETPSTQWTVAQLKDYDRRKRLQAAGEGELLPLEYVQRGRLVVEQRLPLGTKVGPQHSPEQIRDLNIRTAQAHARQTGSHGASWFSDSRGL